MKKNYSAADEIANLSKVGANYDQTVEYWQNLKIKTVNDYQQKLANFKILFAYNSNKIENEKTDYYDTRELFENGKILNYTGDVKTLFEQQNQKICYDFLLPYLESKTKIDSELIKEIHKILTSGTYDEQRYLVNNERPGEFKKHAYIIGKNEIGSAVNKVENDLNDLLAEIAMSDTGAENNYIIMTAAYFHCRFEQIHPFADGNGRVGRTLLNYFLMINDYPPLIVYDDDKLTYYRCLEEFDVTDNLTAMVKFIQYESNKTWHKSMELAKDF